MMFRMRCICHRLYQVLCVGGIRSWSGFRSSVILNGPYIVVVGKIPAAMCWEEM